MKHKTAVLEGGLLDAAVARLEGWVFCPPPFVPEGAKPNWWEPVGDAMIGRMEGAPFSTSWGLAGPIIERERIALLPFAVEGDYEYDAAGNNPRLIAPSRWWAEVMQADEGGWIERCPEAFTPSVDHGCGIGATPLIAAMRAFCASRFGDEVEL